MERSRQDIFTLYSLSPKGFPTSNSDSEPYQIKTWHLFDTSRLLPANLKSFPAPPFMVPAILDALSRSEYASVTQVVPDEADPYCARAAKESGGSVLTSDSDMLVYDLGDRGAVLFLNSLELLHPSPSSAESFLCEEIIASACRPSELMRRLDVESFQRLCFEIKENPSITFLTALKLAKLPLTKPQELRQFLEQYKTSFLSNSLPTQICTQKVYYLDPLISDLLHQTNPTTDQLLHTYLPTLIDDPSKTPAWTPSALLRFFAYTYASSTSLDHHHKRQPAIEHRRKGTRIVAENILRLSDADSITYATTLSARMQALRNAFPDLPGALSWRLLALCEILAWHDDVGKKSPSTSILVRTLTGTAGRIWGWEDIHLEAQVQGVLYSLRMVVQILQRISPEGRFTDPGAFVELAAVLEGLPPLAELLPSRIALASQVPQGFDAEVVLDTLATLSRAGDEIAEEGDVGHDQCIQKQNDSEPRWEEPKKKKSGKKIRRDRRKEEEIVKREGGVNRFSLLDNA